MTIVIGGPTGSGKSALALALAAHFNGAIINADSMQVYDGLRILTARPGAPAEARVPHRLYGVMDPRERCSAGRWRELALAEVTAARGMGRSPLLVGGTGLYFRALLKGLAPVPDIADEVRRGAAELFDALGREAFYARITELDPHGVAQVSPGNTQRLLRLYEVVTATGKPLHVWQAMPVGDDATAALGPVLELVLWPDRAALYTAIDARVEQMVDEGVLEEVEALLARNLPPDVPAMKAVGLREFAAHLRGETSLEEGVARAQTATRRYAKRQMTWFRHQMPDAVRLEGFGADMVGVACQAVEQAKTAQAG